MLLKEAHIHTFSQVISIWHNIVCKIKYLVEIFCSMDSMYCSIRGTYVSYYLLQCSLEQ
jgi:hypothetical protein